MSTTENEFEKLVNSALGPYITPTHTKQIIDAHNRDVAARVREAREGLSQIIDDEMSKAVRRGRDMTKTNRTKFARDNETLGESQARNQGFKSGLFVIKGHLARLAQLAQEDKSEANPLHNKNSADEIGYKSERGGE